MNSKIKQLREKIGLTQYEISHILGVPENTVKQWESGRRSPRGPARSLIALVDLIAEQGSVSIDELLRKVGRNYNS